MNCEANKNLDRYISRAFYEGCGEIARAYDAIDTQDVYIHPRLDRRVYRLIRRGEAREVRRGNFHVVKRALIGVLLISFIFFAAILTIAAARGELVSSIVTWYDDHLSIDFGAIEDLPEDGMQSSAPTYLKELYEPQIFGYTRKCERLDDINYETFVLGYYDDVQVRVCRYQQAVWRLSLAPQDEDAYHITEVDVGAHRGTLYEEKNGVNLILVWDDGRYHYKLESDTFLEDELIGWAKHLRTAYDVMPSPIVDIRRPVIRSSVITSQVLINEPDYISTDYYRDGSYVCRFVQTTTHRNEGGVLYGIYGTPQRVADVVIGRQIGVAYIYSGMIQIIWEDDEYQYRMQSPCMTLKEMVRWAEATESVDTRFVSIQQILSPRGFSPDIEERVFEKSRRRVEIDYYRDGEKICVYTQMTLSAGVPHRGTGYVEQPILIHHAQGIFRQYDNGTLVMIWNDDCHRYRLESQHLSRQELLDWALSVAPPIELEELRKPMISGEMEETLTELTDRKAQYSYFKEGQELAVFRQLVMNERAKDYDSECVPRDIFVGEHHGVALVYNSGKIMLVWTDQTYSYELESNVMTLEQLLIIGTSVTPILPDEEDGEPSDELPLPERLEEIFLPDYASIGGEAKEMARTDEEVTTKFYLDHCLIGTMTQSILRADMMEYTDGSATVKRGVDQGRFCYTIYTWDDGKIIRVWTDGQYRYRLEIEQRYASFLPVLSNIPQT